MNERSATRRFAAPVVLALVMSLGSLMAMSSSSAQTSARLAFLNPSGFAHNGSTGIVVTDTEPGAPQTGTGTFVFSVWASGAPTSSLLEFEVTPVSTLPSTLAETVEGVRIGPDTFEGYWDINLDWPDGQYEVKAVLYDGVNELATITQNFILRRGATRAEIVEPERGDTVPQWGTFTPLKAASSAASPSPTGRIGTSYTDAQQGSATTLVRAFYTTSAPGSTPSWKTCGTEKTARHPSVPNGATEDGVACALGGATDQSRVTAIAVVANSSTSDYNPALNGAGDAMRITPYAQRPTRLAFEEGGVGESVDLDERTEDFPCHLVETELVDQFSRPVVGANLDVHAWGPGESIKFETGAGAPAPIRGPDRANHPTELGYDCVTRTSTEQTATSQGKHAVHSAPDLKHVESGNAGSGDLGNWGFRLKVNEDDVSGDNYTTQLVVWVDEVVGSLGANNDVLDQGEIALCGSVGFGSSPEPPVGEPVVSLAECTGEAPPPPDPTLTPTPDPSTSTSPSPDPTPRPPAARSISVNKKVRRDGRILLVGRLRSPRQSCVSGWTVNLEKKAKSGFRAVASVRTTQKGGFTFVRNRRPAARYRVTVFGNSRCAAAKSKTIRVP